MSAEPASLGVDYTVEEELKQEFDEDLSVELDGETMEAATAPTCTASCCTSSFDGCEPL